ncbi:folliculin [Trichogramma pretiosum]|uniref:folliculin n=1 Tax=Trichogramma pretiosum TaxID=7493 RepID=UPI0006C9CD0E|nr:folliculin [Trichogramma pretiosum]XP_014232797.1 folliculin [Trichogramma pretiosum]
MNAVIALCTFCELHGPKVIFTTQTFRNFDNQNNEKLKFYGPKEVLRQDQSMNSDTQWDCQGCYSLGNHKYLSNEHETRTSFLSAQQSLMQEICALLKYACIRSLSCEVHPGKEGVCYFGDESRGHVLSHTFSLKDAQARGLRKWCSFIVLMKDKQYLLNMWPFLVDNLKEIIRELQEFAIKKYNAEEAECPQRVVRLANGDKSSNKLSRGFSEITNEKNVFVRVHMWFVWILSAGARHFVEVLPLSLIDEEIDFNLGVSLESDKGFTLLNAKSPVNLNVENQIPDFKDFTDLNPVSVLRKLKNKVGFDQFRQLLYATLIGTQILIRGSPAETLESLYGLCSLVPRACQIVRVGAKEYIDSKSCNFISVDTSVAVPFPCAAVCRLDILPEEHLTEGNKSHVVRWTGQLPAKLPTLQIKLEKALGNDKLTDTVLHVHFSTLQEEWSNISKVVHAMRGRGHRGDLTSLLISLGAGPQDRKLIEAWSMGLPSNPA